MTSLKLQRLWETLARASAAEGGVAAVERDVCRQLDALTCADLCVDPSPSTAASGSAPPVITTQSVYESDAFDIVVFVFPANAAIPLHDHPAMTVFSKVLYGALAMVSFDWAAPPSAAELDAFTREQARLEELAAGAPPTPDGRGGGQGREGEEPHGPSAARPVAGASLVLYGLPRAAWVDAVVARSFFFRRRRVCGLLKKLVRFRAGWEPSRVLGARGVQTHVGRGPTTASVL